MEHAHFPGAPAAAAGGAPAAAAAPAAAKTDFSIKLVKFDAAAKIKIIKEVRELTKLDLKAAKELVEAAPKTLIKDLKKDEADKAIEKLKAAGAVVELEVRDGCFGVLAPIELVFFSQVLQKVRCIPSH